MKNARRKLSVRYLTALRMHLGDPSRSNGDQAQRMGRAVMNGGLATLDLAVMHERAIVALKSSNGYDGTGNGTLKRAGYFFTQALVPFEVSRRTAYATNRQLEQRNVKLRRMTEALSRGNRQLVLEIKRRKAGEQTIRKAKEEYRSLFLESQTMQRQLRQLARQVLAAQEEERKEISRELHDEVVQTLVGISVELSALDKGASMDPEALKSKIARTRFLVEHSMKEVHRFARELRPAVLDDLGLIPALHAYSQNLAERKKLKIQVTAFGGVEMLGVAKRTALFRVAQEALNNIARHAEATEVHMSISKVRGGIQMAIDDNGKSFDVKKTLMARNPKRLGLLGMKERIEMVGGRLIVESRSGKGTTVCAEIPFNLEKSKK
jgi:signal transduction histidine kinase